jgi:predicted nucleotidyltransferase
MDWLLPDHVPNGVRIFLEDLLTNVVETLEDSIEGIILYGSLVAGGFDSETSDLDLLVAVAADIDDAALESLRRMHDQLALAHSEWEDRVDVTYISAVALKTFKEHDSPLVVIGPGEPINRMRTDPGWKAESSDAPELQAYAIVTACRALYTCSTGAQASKEAAALWAQSRYPEWSAPIRDAREWRRRTAGRRSAAKAPIFRGLEFVRFAAGEVSENSEPSGL